MENCYQPSPHSSQDYYPHYNLFQSSIFYDTDNFRVPCLLEESVASESSENEERSAEPPDKPPEAPVKAKRVVAKEELYRDPESFGKGEVQSNINGPVEPPNSLPHPWGYDWTKQSWVKEGAPVSDTARDERATPEHQPAAPRVNNSKAESMMHKMGWQGGALGKTGDGITEPITPKAIHAFRPSPGPGRPGKKAKTPNKATPGKKHPAMRDSFRTNILMLILEFVQDDTETELLFDTSLRQHERRYITNIIHSVVNDETLHSLSSTAQYELAQDIHRRNKYLLECAQGDNHQLGIYKEAPEDVYLVTPDDFSTKDDSDKNVAIENGTNDKINGDMDDDENPFLKSIKKSIKKDDEPKLTNKFETDCVIAKDSEPKVDSKSDVPVTEVDKMLEFFLEFAETDSYKEMRFLGTFTDPQSSAINGILTDVSSWALGSFHGNELVARALRNATLKIRDGANGTPEIHKVPASPGRNLGKT
ncbi:uncharacterized protein LOC125238747 [Leguminivora glycinivorella]|uniref:uncharacterized protein LOC125238747 n=1 Tax=Leguminivora glycinivorella TaxID=1035111 RepID=UPI00200BCDFB|nr:uncharacterized protein LOC125238747 [Leguminivora glycinivorella]